MEHGATGRNSPQQGDGPNTATATGRPASNPEEWMHIETRRFTEPTNKDHGLGFLNNCARHMPSFLNARLLQDILHGVKDVNDSIMNGLVVAVALGLPRLQEDMR